ncbi:HNH endonuclease [Peribacillus asahii]|uniref:HNH endonuclease n=1 Tax=Peribacillus asahii TaxID=228899 RepID=UPI00207A6AB0|nr:HNH endonuclease [Peribacillus asahii]USK84783.1 HNH endonuclease [Peribacillus asahii]
MSKPQTVICRVCQLEKPTDDFRRQSHLERGVDNECNECRKKRRQANGEYLRERARKYQKRKGDAIMLITVEQLESLLTNHSCSYCGEPLTNENATIDHVYPLSQSYGGVNIVENIVSVCRSCNSSKASDHVADFYRRSDKFTTELFQAFARSYGSRLLGRELSELEGRHMARNLIEEAEELRRNAERKDAAVNE